MSGEHLPFAFDESGHVTSDSTGHIDCPACGAPNYARAYFMTDGDSIWVDCDACGAPFVLSCSVTTEYAACKVPAQEAAPAAGGGQ